MMSLLGFMGDAYYQDLGGALPLVPANGFWVGAVVRVEETPAFGTVHTIAQNGNVELEGWDLIMENPGADADGNAQVRFGFRAYDNLGALPVVYSYPFRVDAIDGYLLTGIAFRVFAYYGVGNLGLRVEGSSLPAVGMANAYINSVPLLRLGCGRSGNPFVAPNTIMGLVGGEGTFTFPGNRTTPDGWAEDIALEGQIVGVRTTLGVADAATTNGWRLNNPSLNPGDAPDPLVAFAGATNLVEQGTVLFVVGDQTQFWSDVPLPP
jgi:hypothetical protein